MNRLIGSPPLSLETAILGEQTKRLAKADPVWFVENVIGAKPASYQREVLEAIGKHKKVAWKSGHGVGKTATAAWSVLWFLFTRPQSKIITTASAWRQVAKQLWPEIHKWLKRADLEKLGFDREQIEPLHLMIKIEADWFATGEASDEPERMEGFHAPHLFYIVDEGKAVPNSTFEAIEGALATGETRMLVISTPPPARVGYFYEIFSRKRLGFQTFSTSCLEAVKDGRVSRDWIEGRKAEWGEDSPVYQTRVLGEFAESAEDTLIPLSWIEKAVNRKCEPRGDKVIGADIARFGDDKTVFILRQGIKVLKIEQFGKENLMASAGRLARLIKEAKPSEVNVDEVGLGAGVVDRLREQDFEEVAGVNVGRAAKEKEKYCNKRAEIFYGLRDRFQKGNISIPDNEELIGQLSNIKYEYTSGGQWKIEAKEKMKKRGLKSPDLADALALAFTEVAKPSMTFFGSGKIETI